MRLIRGRSPGPRFRVRHGSGDDFRSPWREQFRGAARIVAAISLLCVMVARPTASALGDIYYNSLSPNAGQVIPGTQGITPGPGVDLSGWNSPGHQLEFADLGSTNLTTASFANSDLNQALFIFSNLSGANLSNANLSQSVLFNSNLNSANLSGAMLGNALLQGTTFTGANIKGASFQGTSVIAAQIYSTASYASGDLAGIVLDGNRLDGWDFSNKNLNGASFVGLQGSAPNFAGANLSHANLSGIRGMVSIPPGTVSRTPISRTPILQTLL